MIVLIFLLACWGLTHILVKGKIFETPRNWLIIQSQFIEGILTCHQCCGFWIGLLLFFVTKNLPNFFLPFIDCIIWGCISSGVCAMCNGVLFFLFSFSKKE